MTKVSKKTEFTTWLIQWVARGISILFILVILLIWVGGAVAEKWREAPWSTLVTM